MASKHTDREYEAELSRLRESILLMGAKVEEMIAASMQALVNRDDELAHRMIEADHAVNQLEIDIDELCLKILARRQPVASDLRFLTIALKLVTDLERIGDLVVNICERVIELNREPVLKPYIDIPKMAERVRAMVRSALDAFVAADAQSARLLLEDDAAVDAYYGQIFRELLTYMMEDPRNIYRATRVQSIAKYLERIGDHATNLAEQVVFMVKGKDIRHKGRDGDAAKVLPPHGVLFVCRQNQARSQLAEAWARKLLPAGVRIWSAGAAPATAVHPLAVEVMREVGLDISGQRPKQLSDVPLGDIDTVIALCAEADCPVVAGPVRRESWAMPDPTSLAGDGSEESLRAAFRTTRDAIRQRIEALAERWR